MLPVATWLGFRTIFQYQYMIKSPSDWDAQKRVWGSLKGLRASTIDLDRISLIRDEPREQLSQPERLETLLLQLGLNDEGLDEFPSHLQPYCGSGLRIWQYPSQFSKYLAHVSQLGVRSYMELGIRHGGSFVATVEILSRFIPLNFAVAVDIIPCPSMADYEIVNSCVEFACINTQSSDFNSLIDRLRPIDLVFIDSHHEESQCRREFESVRDAARVIAFHDISNMAFPGIAHFWEELKSTERYRCFEYTQQYEGTGPFMGIGLAIRKDGFLP